MLRSLRIRTGSVGRRDQAHSVLDEHWPFSCLQLYCDATVDEDPDLVVDVMMAVGGRMSGQPLGEDAANPR